MTCMNALETMLDADLHALGGRVSTPLAQHLRECARCRCVALQLVHDTRALSAAVPVVGTSRRPWPLLIGAGALAAALVLLVVRFAPPTPATVAVEAPAAMPAPASRDTTTPAANPAITRRAATPVRRAPTHTHRPHGVLPGSATTRVAIAPPVFAPPVPVTVRPIDLAPVVTMPSVLPSPLDVSAPPPPDSARDRVDVRIDPRSRQRAVVMRTSNPRITVVWLY